MALEHRVQAWVVTGYQTVVLGAACAGGWQGKESAPNASLKVGKAGLGLGLQGWRGFVTLRGWGFTSPNLSILPVFKYL